MLLDLFQLKSVEITGKNSLYPNGINWKLLSGLNIIVGGTGLGKTTLINAVLFGLFGDLGKSSNRETESVTCQYFSERFGKGNPTNIVIEAEFAGKIVFLKRELSSGRVVEVRINGDP